MILIDDILQIHNASINAFGGSPGIRDLGLLEAAIARPFQTFGGEDLYPDPFFKAAALAESIVKNHPFIDGNKRTGFVAMAAFLMESGYRLVASQEDAYEAIIDLSTGIFGFDDLVGWIKEHVVPYNNNPDFIHGVSN